MTALYKKLAKRRMHKRIRKLVKKVQRSTGGAHLDKDDELLGVRDRQARYWRLKRAAERREECDP